MALWQFFVLAGLLVWIGLTLRIGLMLKTASRHIGWEYLIVNVTGDIEEMESTINDRGRLGSELVMIWSPPREDEELASVLREVGAPLSTPEAAEIKAAAKAALEELGLKPYPRQIYAIFKRRMPISDTRRA